MVANEYRQMTGDVVEECANCGERIDVTTWYLATADRSADGVTTITSFCSERCRDEWEA